MLPSRVRSYTLHGLSGTPATLTRLLRELPRDSAKWDVRPDAERFTLREILCHMVDFDEIGFRRLKRIVTEEAPHLENWDEGAAVLANDYASADPEAILLRLAAHRETLMQWLDERDPTDWSRTASHPQLGTFALEEFVVLFLAHDAYHVRQVTQWLEETDGTSLT